VTASAQVDCDTLPSPVYGLGGSAAVPLIGAFAGALRHDADPTTVIFQAPGACIAMNALLDGAPMTGTATYWDEDGAAQTCTLPAEGQTADYGYMGVFPESCPGVSTVPETLGNFAGPVTTWNLIVPQASSQQSISSEAVYLVYGFGAESQAAPWTDEAQLFRRNPTSAALLAIAAASQLPPDRFLGTDVGTNQAMVTNLATSTNPEAAIGFVSGEVADAARGQVRTLAFQYTGQSCGYWPDSSATAFDKINVRQGRYWLWTNHRFYTILDEDGHIPNPHVARFIEAITGEAEPTSNLSPLDVIIESGTIPVCAMEVTRSGDYTDIEPYAAPAPCGCYYDFKATGASTCDPCATSDDCSTAAPVCRLGFCEER
jgi:hypothetical protein